MNLRLNLRMGNDKSGLPVGVGKLDNPVPRLPRIYDNRGMAEGEARYCCTTFDGVEGFEDAVRLYEVRWRE